jgi:hypothetical protein
VKKMKSFFVILFVTFAIVSAHPQRVVELDSDAKVKSWLGSIVQNPVITSNRFGSSIDNKNSINLFSLNSQERKIYEELASFSQQAAEHYLKSVNSFKSQ